MILKINKDKSAVLHTHMTAQLAGVVGMLEGHRRWLKSGGLSLEPTLHNIELLRGHIPDLEVQLPEEDKSESFDIPAKHPYKQKTKPYKHQKIALGRALEHDHFGLFMEQGTGKTKVALDRVGMLFGEGNITGLLVVAPKGVHRQWIEHHFPTHYGAEFAGAFWPRKSGWPDLNPGDKLKVFAINYDGLKTAKGMLAASLFIQKHRGQVFMVADESHNIKNARSQRWKACDDIGKKCRYRFAMTGTPIAKDLTDEWSQLKWLNQSILGIKYVTAFRREYCVMGGFEGRVVIGHRNIDRFKEKVAPYTFRATKDEIGILPKQYDTWRFDMTVEQKRMIKSLRTDLIANMDSGAIVNASHAAVAVLRMQQVSNGFLSDKTEDGATVVHQLFDSPWLNPRVIALRECLDNIEGKVCIWAKYHNDIHTLVEVLGDDCVVYYGPSTTKERGEALENFMDIGGAKYFVASPGAAGEGIDGLQANCNRAIYYSNSDNSIHRWQSEDRTHRIGTKGNVTYTDLIAIGSPDVKMRWNLMRKKSLSDMVLGDIRQWLTEMED